MWYHITKSGYMGKSKILRPYIPDLAGEDEGNIPRICVSNSLWKCLKALTGRDFITTLNMKNMFTENPCVYFSEEHPYIPPSCSDFRDNDERWFIKKTKFYYLARIDLYNLFVHKKIVPTYKKELVLPKHESSVYKVNEMFIQKLIAKGELK